MSAQAGIGETSSYFSRLFRLLLISSAQLVRTPSNPRRAEAARRLRRDVALATAVLGIAIIALMVAVDAWEIAQMPPRGTAGLWPVRILTDFGKAANVLWSLAALLLVTAIVIPLIHGGWRSRLMRLGTRLQFLFLAVLVPVLSGEVIKWIVGRGRPFVGGKANAFNFSHFAGSEAYASFPSAHAITAFALAFAVSAIWPRAWIAMSIYAVAIAATRLVLLAHHPSDVVGGALIGVVGAMCVRYWFAVRRLGFGIRSDGAIVPLAGRLKGVAREPSAP
ncbi:MAG TPA: phosphatase PAP2 family protein [Bradyrhizobium sp.]|nr:phosphatase PAP2 family protein [Bradyrhizobium sp.]